jgi:penicillin-binding protein A
MAGRIRWLGVFIVLCFVVLFVQLNELQVVHAKQYADNTANPEIEYQMYSQPRGPILSADGVVLAQSVPTTVGAYKYQREYPTGSLFSQVVGYDSLIYPPSGVEATYNADLSAHNRPIKTLSDLLATPMVTDTVTLTMSDALQKDLAAALDNRYGAIVVLDPSTGAVEAMYSNPTFDPNPLVSPYSAPETQAYATDTTTDQYGFQPLASIAYQDSFFPGSTFKTVTTAAAYDHAPRLVDTPMPYYTCIPPHTFGGQFTKLCNFGDGGCGGTIAQMLPPSCDTGYALLGTKVGAAGMTAEADAFGFNQQPPIDLPSSPFEVSHFLQSGCYMNAQVFLAFSSIGQYCTTASPLQMAMVASAFANGGVIMKPHVMASVRDSLGNPVATYQPTKWLTATTPKTAAAVTTLMTDVAKYGTAAGIFPADEDVAAKTGTAQVAQNNSETTDWMIAFAPATAPKVAVAVVLPNQALSATGAEVAGPVMRAILRDALGY